MTGAEDRNLSGAGSARERRWASRSAATAACTLWCSTTKRLVDEAGSHSFQAALDAESRAQTVNLMGPEAPEAYQAYVDRRDPVFTDQEML